MPTFGTWNHQEYIGGKPRVQGSPLFYKAPQHNFSLQKCKLTASKVSIGEGRFCASLYKTADWRSPMTLMEGANSCHFGRCQLAFWRLKLSWGCFVEKGGGGLKRGGTMRFPGLYSTNISVWRVSRRNSHPETTSPTHNSSHMSSFLEGNLGCVILGES